MLVLCFLRYYEMIWNSNTTRIMIHLWLPIGTNQQDHFWIESGVFAQHVSMWIQEYTWKCHDLKPRYDTKVIRRTFHGVSCHWGKYDKFVRYGPHSIYDHGNIKQKLNPHIFFWIYMNSFLNSYVLVFEYWAICGKSSVTSVSKFVILHLRVNRPQ